MPELPEVETVRRGLQERFVGRQVTEVEVGRERVVRRTSSAALIAGLSGVTALRAERHGKYLLCPLDSGDTLMIHLRMSGRVLIAARADERPAHTHVALTLADPPGESLAEELRFVDPRTFGEMVVFDPQHVDVEIPEVSRLGLDPIAHTFSVKDVRRLLGTRTGRSSHCCSTST